jgi:hypothetical protein
MLFILSLCAALFQFCVSFEVKKYELGGVPVNETAAKLMANAGDDWKPVKNKVLVIINGEIRGGSAAYNSTIKYLLDFYHADLAIIGPGRLQHDNAEGEYLRLRAKYYWILPEMDDYGIYIDPLASVVGLPPGSDINRNWRELCQMKAQFLGGVQRTRLGGIYSPERTYSYDCHIGSAGILFVYRAIVAQYVRELGLTSKYDWFIYTRADYLYLCYPPPIEHYITDVNAVYIPRFEGYGGYTDRHVYASSKTILPYLDLTAYMLRNWETVRDVMLSVKHSNARNIEIMIAVYLEAINMTVRTVDQMMLTVRRPNSSDYSSFHARDKRHRVNNDIAKLYPNENLLVKYQAEFNIAHNSCRGDYRRKMGYRPYQKFMH